MGPDAYRTAGLAEAGARNPSGMGLEMVTCQSAEAAMEGAQIVTTCTADKQYATILTDNMVGNGVHINAIGGDCPGKTELAPAILHRSSIFMEYPEQTRMEGEIQQLDPDNPRDLFGMLMRAAGAA